MEHKMDPNSLPAETVAVEIALGSVLASLAKIDPVIHEAISDGFIAATCRTQRAAKAIMGKRPSAQQMAGIRRRIEEMRSIVLRDDGEGG